MIIKFLLFYLRQEIPIFSVNNLIKYLLFFSFLFLLCFYFGICNKQQTNQHWHKRNVIIHCIQLYVYCMQYVTTTTTFLMLKRKRKRNEIHVYIYICSKLCLKS